MKGEGKRLRLKTSPIDENSDLVEQYTQSYGLLLYLLLKLPGVTACSIVFFLAFQPPLISIEY